MAGISSKQREELLRRIKELVEKEANGDHQDAHWVAAYGILIDFGDAYVVVTPDRRVNSCAKGNFGFWPDLKTALIWPGMTGTGWMDRCIRAVRIELKRARDLHHGRAYRTMDKLYAMVHGGCRVQVNITDQGAKVYTGPYDAPELYETLAEAVDAVEF